MQLFSFRQIWRAAAISDFHNMRSFNYLPVDFVNTVLNLRLKMQRIFSKMPKCYKYVV